MLVLHFGHAWVSLLDPVYVTYYLVGIADSLLIVFPVTLHIQVVTILLVSLNGHEFTCSRVSAIRIVSTAFCEHHSVKEDSLLHDIALKPAVVHRVNKSCHIFLGGILRFRFLIHVHISFIVAGLGIQIQVARCQRNNCGCRHKHIYLFHTASHL